SGVLGQLDSGERSCLRKRTVETQLVADDHVAGGHRRTEVVHEPPKQIIEPVVVDGGHGILLIQRMPKACATDLGRQLLKPWPNIGTTLLWTRRGCLAE